MTLRRVLSVQIGPLGPFPAFPPPDPLRRPHVKAARPCSTSKNRVICRTRSVLGPCVTIASISQRFFWICRISFGTDLQIESQAIDVKKSKFGGKNHHILRRQRGGARQRAYSHACQMAGAFHAAASGALFRCYKASNLVDCGSTGSYRPRRARRDGSCGFFHVGLFVAFGTGKARIPNLRSYGSLTELRPSGTPPPPSQRYFPPSDSEPYRPLPPSLPPSLPPCLPPKARQSTMQVCNEAKHNRNPFAFQVLYSFQIGQSSSARMALSESVLKTSFGTCCGGSKNEA